MISLISNRSLRCYLQTYFHTRCFCDFIDYLFEYNLWKKIISCFVTCLFFGNNRLEDKEGSYITGSVDIFSQGCTLKYNMYINRQDAQNSCD